ncbi:unnamed protein product [Ectocarpus sp. 6 AP-2014]
MHWVFSLGFLRSNNPCFTPSASHHIAHINAPGGSHPSSATSQTRILRSTRWERNSSAYGIGPTIDAPGFLPSNNPCFTPSASGHIAHIRLPCCGRPSSATSQTRILLSTRWERNSSAYGICPTIGAPDFLPSNNPCFTPSASRHIAHISLPCCGRPSSATSQTHILLSLRWERNRSIWHRFYA